MSGITLNAEVASLRPSRLAAEALVNRHNQEQVERRAKAMGIPLEFAEVVASVCCRCSDVETMSRSARSAGDDFPQS
jgi:hypothetical protein